MARKSEGIRAVAEAAGVSVTTVSHALNGRGQVSVATRRKVEEAAARLGYAPNRFAAGLRSARTGLIGLVSEEIATTPYAGSILVGAQEAAAEQGSMVMIVDVVRDCLDSRAIDVLLAQRVDAVIFASSSHRVLAAPDRLDPLRTVLVDAQDPTRRSPSVVPDELAIGLAGTRRLLDAGHREILHVTVDEDVPAVEGRERGFRGAMQEAAGTPHVVRTTGPGDAAAGSIAVRRAIGAGVRFTAVFAFNDQMAMGVYQELAVLGRRVPDDVSVVGVDDLEIVAGALRPGLTTVALPHREMGRRAVELTAVLPAALTAPAETVRLAGRLVERASVAPIVTRS